MTFRVETGHGGSYCVVWKTPGHYLEARKDVRMPNHSQVELVRQGRVYMHLTIRNEEAPERIVRFMKESM